MGRAVQWATEELHIPHWDVNLFVDDSAASADLLDMFDEDDELAVASTIMPPGLQAEIAVRTVISKKIDVDPIFDLFHEMAHIVIADNCTADEDLMWEELLSNRIAHILYKLWGHMPVPDYTKGE
jgi:hypothetical protein